VSGDVKDDPEGFCLCFEDGDEYREACNKLAEPDNFHKLAELGWVVAKCGDEAMSNEPANFKLRFLEITTVATGDSDKAPSAEKIRKDSQKDDTTEQDRDDDLNPVETKDYTSDDRQKGVGDAKDGSDPEGKPKGSTKSESMVEALLGEGGHKAGCQCGFCKNKGKGFGKKDKADHTAPEGGHEDDTTGIGKQEAGDMPEGAEAIVATMLEGKKKPGKGKMVAKSPGKVVREDCGAPKCKKSPKTKPVAKSPGKVTHEAEELPEPPRVDEMTTVGAIPPLEAPMALNGGPTARPDAKERLRRLKMRRDPEGIEGQ
jgi:hypothetical protein